MRRSAALSLVVFIAVAPSAFAQFFIGWSIREFQPDIANGGRANTIAVNPTNNDIIVVASESGGLFRSTNRGTTWHHVDSLPEFSTMGVTFVPANSNVVIATTGSIAATEGAESPPSEFTR